MPFDLIPLAILLAIAPGYVLIYFATLGRTGRALTPDLHLILQCLVVSAAILAPLAPFAFFSLWPHRDHLTDYAWSIALWLVVIVVAVPYVIGRVIGGANYRIERNPLGRLAKLVRLAVPVSPPPTIWDDLVLSQMMENGFVVIEYRDGRRIAGEYQSALASPEAHGIYLSAEWTCDDSGLRGRVTGTKGVVVPIGDDVRCIHLLESSAAGKPAR